MRIVIEVDENGVGTYQQGDQEPMPCFLTNIGQSIRTTPIYSLGSLQAVEFLRDSNMEVNLSLSVRLPQPEPKPVLDMAGWDPDEYEECGCELCWGPYEEE